MGSDGRRGGRAAAGGGLTPACGRDGSLGASALPHSLIFLASWAALLLVTSFVLWAGDRAVRTAALLNAANWLVNTLVQPPRRVINDAFAWPHFISDSLFAVVFVIFTLRVQRSWAALLTAFILLGVANHLSFLFDDNQAQRAFAVAGYLWAYGVLGCLVWAAAWSTPRGGLADLQR